MTESPVDTLRRAAARMRKLAEAATPGPWERPLDVRSKAIVIAALPADEEPRQYLSGIIPAEFAKHGGPTGRYAGQRERTVVVSAPSNNITGFDRKRSGRDLEYIASMHSLVGVAVAEWLEWTADRAADELYRDTPEGPCCAEPSACGGHDETWFCRRCAEVVGEDCACWDRALAAADAYLTEVPA
jgi:hypothetical protein